MKFTRADFNGSIPAEWRKQKYYYFRIYHRNEQDDILVVGTNKQSVLAERLVLEEERQSDDSIAALSQVKECWPANYSKKVAYLPIAKR